MTKKKLNEVLRKHALWRENKEGGEKAILSDADLCGADLHDANLCCANLCCANLCCANLCCANLRDANLCDANLRDANLHDTDLRGANLRGANIDYSNWPMFCGSMSVKIDARIAAQLVYHAVRAAQSACDDAGVRAFCNAPEVIALANRFHRVKDCGEIKPVGEEVKHG